MNLLSGKRRNRVLFNVHESVVPEKRISLTREFFHAIIEGGCPEAEENTHPCDQGLWHEKFFGVRVSTGFSKAFSREFVDRSRVKRFYNQR